MRHWRGSRYHWVCGAQNLNACGENLDYFASGQWGQCLLRGRGEVFAKWRVVRVNSCGEAYVCFPRKICPALWCDIMPAPHIHACDFFDGNSEQGIFVLNLLAVKWNLQDLRHFGLSDVWRDDI